MSYEFIDGTNPSRDFERQKKKEEKEREFEHRVRERAGELINACEGDHREDWAWELAHILARQQLTPKRVGSVGVQVGITTLDELMPFAAEHVIPKLQSLQRLLSLIAEDLED